MTDSALPVRGWVADANSAIADPWSPGALQALAAKGVPDAVLGGSGWLLRSDAAATWARWYFEAFADTARYVDDDSLNFGPLYAQVRDGLRTAHHGAPDDEIADLARAVALAAWRDVRQRRSARRHRLSEPQREELWFREEPGVRCYLCGYLFTSHAKARFLRRVSRADPVALPLLVDFLRPRGRNARDVDAEADHVLPVAGGGPNDLDNLRIACGWCNRAKSRYAELYDAAAWSPATFDHPRLGKISLPQPLWVVRLVGVRKRCEWQGGCAARLAADELFLAPRRLSGALNPLNAAVYCAAHDPWASERFVGPSLLP